MICDDMWCLSKDMESASVDEPALDVTGMTEEVDELLKDEGSASATLVQEDIDGEQACAAEQQDSRCQWRDTAVFTPLLSSTAAVDPGTSFLVSPPNAATPDDNAHDKFVQRNDGIENALEQTGETVLPEGHDEKPEAGERLHAETPMNINDVQPLTENPDVGDQCESAEQQQDTEERDDHKEKDSLLLSSTHSIPDADAMPLPVWSSAKQSRRTVQSSTMQVQLWNLEMTGDAWTEFSSL
ncbi:unnamed protein product [Amoebophrya sp. A25]|nr:unnamed protein product [Amoebophrya sp. A25]|eukprot:GSA25T00022587001.1